MKIAILLLSLTLNFVEGNVSAVPTTKQIPTTTKANLNITSPTNPPTPVDGGWSVNYGPCNATCGGGWQVKTCDNPSPKHGGKNCTLPVPGRACNLQQCVKPCKPKRASCMQQLNVTWWPIAPYIYKNGSEVVGIFPEILKMLVKKCCHDSTDRNKECTTVNYKETPELDPDGVKVFDQYLHDKNQGSVHIPVTGNVKDTWKLGKPFIQLLQSPGIMHLTGKMVNNDISDTIFETVLQVWPVLFFTLVLSAVWGITIWVCDSYFNPAQFPANFFRGSWQGFWWAIVSITTVGYGDRAPKSAGARTMSLIWFIVGLALISVLNAKFTTTMTTMMLADDGNTVAGKEVIAVAGTEEYAYAISAGAKKVEHKATVEEWIRRLRYPDHYNNSLLVDANVITYYKKDLDPHIKNKEIRELGMIPKKTWVYGMFLNGIYEAAHWPDEKDDLPACFLKEITIESSFITKLVQDRMAFLANPPSSLDDAKMDSLFDPNSRVFQDFCIGSAVIIVLMLAIGLAYEKYRAWLQRKQLMMRNPDTVIEAKEAPELSPDMTFEQLIEDYCNNFEQTMKQEVDFFYAAIHRSRNEIRQFTDADLLEICKKQKEFEVKEEEEFLDFMPIACKEKDDLERRRQEEAELNDMMAS